MARVITPYDWMMVGKSFQVIVQAEPDDPELELRVAHRDEFTKNQAASHPVAVADVVPVPGSLLRRCHVTLPADGYYILMLGRKHAWGPYTTFSGVSVHDAQAWTSARPRFPTERARTAGAPFFSIITTVYDIDTRMLEETVKSVLAQEFRDFEWLVLDNGSRLPETIKAVEALASRDPRIKTFRVEENIHIVRGNRYVLERALGEYVLPIDADDLLYPEALLWLVRGIRANAGVAIVFADEEKIDAFDDPISPLYREIWTRIGAMATVPAAHPMAYRRDLAMQFGAYTDERTLGSHDWDTGLRFTDNHQRAVHVAAILYGWRVHGASTALDGKAKSYIENSQTSVVQASLDRRGLDHLFDLQVTPAGLGYFHVIRRPVQPVPIFLLLLMRSGDAAVLENALETLKITGYPLSGVIVAGTKEALTPAACKLLTEASVAKGFHSPHFRGMESFASLQTLRDMPGLEGPGGHVAIVDAALRPTSENWVWDAFGALQLDEDVGIVGGYILGPGGTVQHYGLVTGLADKVVTPYFGHDKARMQINQTSRHRAVSGVHCGFALVRDSVVQELGLPSAADWDAVSSNPAWSLKLLQSRRIAAMVPSMFANRNAAFQSQGRFEVPPLAGRYPELPGVDPFYSWYLSRWSETWGLVKRDEL